MLSAASRAARNLLDAGSSRPFRARSGRIWLSLCAFQHFIGLFKSPLPDDFLVRVVVFPRSYAARMFVGFDHFGHFVKVRALFAPEQIA